MALQIDADRGIVHLLKVGTTVTVVQVADRILFDVFQPAMLRAVDKLHKPQSPPAPIPVGPRAPKPSVMAAEVVAMDVEGSTAEDVVMETGVGDGCWTKSLQSNILQRNHCSTKSLQRNSL